MAFADLFRKKASGDVAKSRLMFVLSADRAGCTPEVIENIKNDIIEVLSRYVEIDKDGLDIKVNHSDTESSNGGPSLYANIPIKGMRRK
ncbi:MAG: cell division topological specificity factor MinE [Lachnospiraceae bacterium]|nr:cell division topological specificity factor MinE [Lachnospiraceae bacterium]